MRFRIILIVVFAICGVGLFFAGRLWEPRGIQRQVGGRTAGDASVDKIIDSLFDRYHIDKASIRTRHVAIAGKTFTRIEQRCAAPPGFLGLVFNHELSARLAPIGAHVVAVEHTKDNSLTVFIVKDHAVIRSLIVAFSTPSGESSPGSGM